MPKYTHTYILFNLLNCECKIAMFAFIYFPSSRLELCICSWWRPQALPAERGCSRVHAHILCASCVTIRTHIHTLHTNIDAHIHTNKHTLGTYIHTYIYINTYIHTHLHTYTYIHTLIYTCMCNVSCTCTCTRTCYTTCTP